MQGDPPGKRKLRIWIVSCRDRPAQANAHCQYHEHLIPVPKLTRRPKVMIDHAVAPYPVTSYFSPSLTKSLSSSTAMSTVPARCLMTALHPPALANHPLFSHSTNRSRVTSLTSYTNWTGDHGAVSVPVGGPRSTYDCSLLSSERSRARSQRSGFSMRGP